MGKREEEKNGQEQETQGGTKKMKKEAVRKMGRTWAEGGREVGAGSYGSSGDQFRGLTRHATLRVDSERPDSGPQTCGFLFLSSRAYKEWRWDRDTEPSPLPISTCADPQIHTDKTADPELRHR